jgi:3-oxoacyl-[acyl-carrier protein] reductase
MNKLLGKRVLITAGAQGIGYAISQQLLHAGCEVFVHFYTSAAGAQLLARQATELGRRYENGMADLTETEQCERVVNDAVRFLGGLDILINNAGSLIERRAFAESSDDLWAETMSLNLGSMRKVTRAAVPHLTEAAKIRGGASIVNISSLAGRRGGGPGSTPYAAAKGAVLALTRALATELGPLGIRANAIAPGLVLGTKFHATHTPADAQRAMIDAIPLGRPGQADDVARAAAYLASEYDGFITGATLDVNGGAYSA